MKSQIRMLIGVGIFCAAGCGILILNIGFLRGSQKEYRHLSVQLGQAKGWNESAALLETSGSGWNDPVHLLQSFEQIVSQSGVRVIHLEPRREKGISALESSVEGTPSQIAVFLQKIPDLLAGVHLERVRIQSTESGVRCMTLFTLAEKGNRPQ